MNRTFKVVGRYLPTDDQQPWCRGKENTQAKKRVYTSKKDLDKYASKLMERWEGYYQVEVYELVSNKWVSFEIERGR